MALFHMRLTVHCPKCEVPLVRIAKSESVDLALCPRCLAAGLYEEVVEERNILEDGYPLSQNLKDFVRQLPT